MINCLMCFAASMAAFCLKKRRKRRKRKEIYNYSITTKCSVHIVVPRGVLLSCKECPMEKSCDSKGPSFALGFVSFFVFLYPCVSLICCDQMLSLARHSRLAASFVFRTVCCYHHPPSASRPRGAFPASDRGLWQTSNIVRCNRPLRLRLRLRGVGSMASGGGDASAASEKIALTVREGDSSSAVDMGLKNGRGDGAG